MLKAVLSSFVVLLGVLPSYAQNGDIKDQFSYVTLDGKRGTIVGYDESVSSDFDNGQILRIYNISRNIRSRLLSKDCTSTTVSFAYQAAYSQRSSASKKSVRSPEKLTLNASQTCNSVTKVYKMEWTIHRSNDEYTARTKINGEDQKSLTRPGEHDLSSYITDQEQKINTTLGIKN